MIQRRVRLGGPLDRYVFVEFIKILATTALGFPLLLVIIDLTDNLDKYLARNLPRQDIALSYLYWIPESMFMVLPAAVLFATVFSIGAFTRHSEITAAKASGVSFYRLALPIFAGAVLAALVDLALAEVVPVTNSRRNDLLAEDKFRGTTTRYNFAFAGEGGRVYKVGTLNTNQNTLELVQVERRGTGIDYPTMIIAAEKAQWNAAEGWTLTNGEVKLISDSTPDFAMSYGRMRDNRFAERPTDMMAKPRSPQEMRYRELTRFIGSLERSGGDANQLRVERALKIAIPVTCIIIALFGAPLATSTQRGGAAYGIGISLAVTVVFLMLVQLTKAVGSKGLMPPDLAAWIPSMIFAVVGLVLLVRVRT
ncbi:MAG TPA: LptF/LptG family permease [Gemmatimonadaceae bacterium]|nr:LptF/LptG family permease [Gemmatimonadaceae bacterium]